MLCVGPAPRPATAAEGGGATLNPLQLRLLPEAGGSSPFFGAWNDIEPLAILRRLGMTWTPQFKTLR